MSNLSFATARRIPLPQRLLIASSLGYGGVFALLLAFGRPGLGLGQAFYIPIILAALGSGPAGGAVAGSGALLLYELAMHARYGFTWSGLLVSDGAGVRFVSYVAAGAVVGFAATRGRRMLVASLHALEDLLSLARRDLDTGAATTGALDLAIGNRLESGEPFALLVSELAQTQRQMLRNRPLDGLAHGAREIARLLAKELGPDGEVARVGPTQFALVTAAASDADVLRLREACEQALDGAGWNASLGWATHPQDGGDPIALYAAAAERLYTRLGAH
jgi:GGDEF domain-containing protein